MLELLLLPVNRQPVQLVHRQRPALDRSRQRPRIQLHPAVTRHRNRIERRHPVKLQVVSAHVLAPPQRFPRRHFHGVRQRRARVHRHQEPAPRPVVVVDRQLQLARRARARRRHFQRRHALGLEPLRLRLMQHKLFLHVRFVGVERLVRRLAVQEPLQVGRDRVLGQQPQIGAVAIALRPPVKIHAHERRQLGHINALEQRLRRSAPFVHVDVHKAALLQHLAHRAGRLRIFLDGLARRAPIRSEHQHHRLVLGPGV